MCAYVFVCMIDIHILVNTGNMVEFTPRVDDPKVEELDEKHRKVSCDFRNVFIKFPLQSFMRDSPIKFNVYVYDDEEKSMNDEDVQKLKEDSSNKVQDFKPNQKSLHYTC